MALFRHSSTGAYILSQPCGKGESEPKHHNQAEKGGGKLGDNCQPISDI